MITFNKIDCNEFTCSELLPYTETILKNNDHRLLHNIQKKLSETNTYYSILGYFSTLFDDKEILEIGTRFGLSALALSYNETNLITSYDIKDHKQSLIQKDNIEFIIENLFTKLSKELTQYFLIVVDIDPHDGENETKLIKFLRKNKYQGILILDDIFLNDEMHELWNSIKRIKKYELNTKYGIGILDFGNNLEVI